MRAHRLLTRAAVPAALLAPALLTTTPAQAVVPCYADSARHLHCGNVYNASVKQVPAYDRGGVPVPTVDYLRTGTTSPSWFQCWVTGQRHSGGNSVWYRTYGDVTGRWGYVAAAAVYTPRDPFPGVAPC